MIETIAADQAQEGQHMISPARGLIEAVQPEVGHEGETVTITIWAEDANGGTRMVGLQFDPEFGITVEARHQHTFPHAALAEHLGLAPTGCGECGEVL